MYSSVTPPQFFFVGVAWQPGGAKSALVAYKQAPCVLRSLYLYTPSIAVQQSVAAPLSPTATKRVDFPHTPAVKSSSFLKNSCAPISTRVMKLSTTSFGIPMVILLFQLQASQVASFGCGNAGQDFPYPHCASNVRQESYSSGEHVDVVDLLEAPWNGDHQDCVNSRFKTEACCNTDNPEFSVSKAILPSICRRPDGTQL
ncbi:hypothetical protein PGTUg99_030494 [Puccinia graminis f. sp. tritici]|uniref:Uncharacterized protein n=1 Tax=Puccinia graminis f. sp. tritici TaxID=56615 RepID=A0A5B0LWM5_PUCGR|nr:hypothetical protein PGTUg99_030494 [Puccinia graminis f. sp. tritici]